MRVRREGDGAEMLHGSPAAPSEIPDDIRWPVDLERGRGSTCPSELRDMLVAGCSLDDAEMIVIARRGGPEILDSEIARLRHLAALAESIAR